MYLKKLIKRLDSQNSVIRYLKYGIGEIILLVIGILLALQINNWYENYKAEKELNRILEFVDADLQADITELTQLITVYDKKKAVFDSLFRLEEIHYSRDVKTIGLHTNYADLVINSRGYELLALNTQSSNQTADTLVQEILDFYSYFISRNTSITTLLKEHIQEVLSDYQDKYAWYGDFLNNRSTQEMVEDVWSNPGSVNKIYHYDLLASRNYLPNLKAFKEQCESLVFKINNRLKHEN